MLYTSYSRFDSLGLQCLSQCSRVGRKVEVVTPDFNLPILQLEVYETGEVYQAACHDGFIKPLNHDEISVGK
ncbi:MAG: hypothetical protein P8N94_02790 [Gammaproteobacteria bacterium]|jgi:hypothetical protein|nr:hypothetical protein [Gammaproteobacteria bacterium]MDG2336902.1 hypothetical protein [Gammaproteobacteria bacterium]